jgi:hypothetical protein
VVDYCECGNETPNSMKCGEYSLFPSGRDKDLSAPLYLMPKILYHKIRRKSVSCILLCVAVLC